MSIDVTRADDSAIDRWDSFVERSPHGTFFHQLDALEVQAAHAGAELHPLVGFKGQEMVGVLPVFEVSKGPLTAVFSPPPDLLVAYLGPALSDMGEMNRRTAEKRRARFVDGCFEWIDDHLGPNHLHIRTGGRYDDLRPFQWNGCDLSVHYTYEVDLSPGAEAVMANFSSDARRNVRTNGKPPFVLEEGDEDDLRAILEQVRSRYESQGLAYTVPPEFVVDLADRLEGGVRPYVCRVDDEFVGGIVSLEHGDAIYRWQGGVRVDVDVDLPVNDLLDWHVMNEGMDRGRTRYDLVGANNRRINRYKAKFGPELRTFYSVDRGSPLTRMAAKLYKRLR